MSTPLHEPQMFELQMEVPGPYFFSFCAAIGATFFHLGLKTFHKTELSDSVSPVIMSLFKHAFAISISHSSSYALIYRPRQRIMAHRRYFWVVIGFYHALVSNFTLENSAIAMWSCFASGLILSSTRFLPLRKILPQGVIMLLPFLLFTSEIFPSCIPLYALINFLFSFYGERDITAQEKIAVGVHMIIESSLFGFDGGKVLFFPILVIYIAYYTSVSWAAISGLEPYTMFLAKPNPGDEFFQELRHIAARGEEFLSKLGKKKQGKLIEFVVAMMGTVLFQSFFRLTTFDHVTVFLYLAVAWLANLALMQVSWDMGVFNFLLLNVIVGCTVSEFGLRGTSWIAYGASLLLYCLRLQVESLCLVNREREGTRVILW